MGQAKQRKAEIMELMSRPKVTKQDCYNQFLESCIFICKQLGWTNGYDVPSTAVTVALTKLCTGLRGTVTHADFVNAFPLTNTSLTYKEGVIDIVSGILYTEHI